MGSKVRWQEQVRSGFQVFARDGGEEFGAVREVSPGGRKELLVNIENGGDHRIPFVAIVDVHDEKVVIDLARVDPVVRWAAAHAHDAEIAGL